MKAEAKSTPRVSVIMTAYNAAPFLDAAISSVMNQTFEDFELLVADDASKDRSKSIIDEWALKDERIKSHHNSENLHYMRTRNKLFQHAKGEFITFLDADDLIREDRIERQLDAFEKDSELVLCGCAVQHIDENGKPLEVVRKLITEYEDIKKTFATQNPFVGSTIMLKRNALEEVGGYRDFFNGLGNEDYDLTARILEKHKCINLPQKLYLYRQFSGSTSRGSLMSNPYKLHSHALVQHFIHQRANGEKDSLEKQDFDAIEKIVQTLHQPYLDDPSLIHIKQATGFIYSKLFKDAFRASLKAVWAKPLSLYNLRTLFYTARKALLHWS